MLRLLKHISFAGNKNILIETPNFHNLWVSLIMTHHKGDTMNYIFILLDFQSFLYTQIHNTKCRVVTFIYLVKLK